MAEWQNGGMAEWYFTTYLIYPAIFIVHADDTDDCFKSFRCTDKPLGSVYLSTEACPIKVVDTAPRNNIRADEIAIETAKTGKVTEVVAVISIFL